MDGLDASISARIDARLRRVEDGNMGDCHPLTDEVCELRADFGPGYRVYFWQRGDYILILHAGKKDTQRRDIQIAKARLKEFWEDYDAEAQKTP
jgi:putative addiction module killer protein